MMASHQLGSKYFRPSLHHTFSQIDYVLGKKQRRNAVKDINAVQHTSLESDHKMLTQAFA